MEGQCLAGAGGERPADSTMQGKDANARPQKHGGCKAGQAAGPAQQPASSWPHLEGVDGKHNVGDALVHAHAPAVLPLERQHALEEGRQRLLHGGGAAQAGPWPVRGRACAHACELVPCEPCCTHDRSGQPTCCPSECAHGLACDVCCWLAAITPSDNAHAPSPRLGPRGPARLPGCAGGSRPSRAPAP